MYDIALDIMSLVIDVEINRACKEPPSTLDAMLKTLKRLHDTGSNEQ
jgi:hypothetical protein